MRTDVFHKNPDIPLDGISYPSLFNELVAISGGNAEITPEFMIKLGCASACCASRIAVGYSEQSICKLLANAFIAGAGSGGAQVTEFDAGFSAVASYVARNYLFNLTVFIENDKGRLRIKMIDKFGLPIDREFQRKIEAFTHAENFSHTVTSDILMPKSITGTREAFAIDCANTDVMEGFRVSVTGKGIACDCLKYVLSLSGCIIDNEESGIPGLALSDDGESLYIRDEVGFWYDNGHIDALLTLVYFLSGERELAVSAAAPSVIEQISAEFDGRILRIGRDYGAREIFLTQKVLTDAFSSAVFLCSYLHSSKASVTDLVKRLPEFILVSREVSVHSDRQRILSRLTQSADGLHKENTGQLRVCADGGWVNISPARSKSALRITGEGMNEEIASELCNLFIERTKLIDSEESK